MSFLNRYMLLFCVPLPLLHLHPVSEESSAATTTTVWNTWVDFTCYCSRQMPFFPFFVYFFGFIDRIVEDMTGNRSREGGVTHSKWTQAGSQT